MAPSKMVVAWECGACTFTNVDVQRRDCMMCMTERPLRYAIVPGTAGAASARTTTVNRREQALLAAAGSDVDHAFFCIGSRRRGSFLCCGFGSAVLRKSRCGKGGDTGTAGEQ